MPVSYSSVKRCLRRGPFVSLLAIVGLAAACGSPPAHVSRMVAVTRPAGSWQGRGSSTVGFVSDSGQFRISWETHNEQPAGTGTFRLTVHSAVSGRAMQVLAEQRGEGHGSGSFADDPRVYNFMVDSANVDWSFTVEEIVTVDANAPPQKPR
jgi:hypothetical protein